MNIMIAGLTAAGKTTHAQILAERHGLRYESASARILDLVGKSGPIRSDFWVSEEGQRAQGRHDLIKQVDEELVALAGTASGVVFDSFGLPWTSSAPGFRIRIESILSSRVWKAMVSHRYESDVHRRLSWAFAHADEAGVAAIIDRVDHTSGNEHTKVETALLLQEKDYESRRYFQAEYGFDLFEHHDVFDLIVDISSFVAAPSLEACVASIRQADDLIGSAAAWALEPGNLWADRFRHIAAAYDPGVVLKCPPPLL